MQKHRRPELVEDQSMMRKFYEYVAQTKGDIDDYWATGFFQSLLIEKINEILHDVHGKRIIDIGCGDGRTVMSLAKQGNSVVGIDISYTRLLRAKKKARKHADKTLFVQSYAEFLPIKQGAFDGVICTEVLEHVMDDDALLRELAHVLKSNAWVLMSVPNVSLRRYFDMRHLKRPIFFDPIEHVREFSYYKIPFCEKDFIFFKNLEGKLASDGLIVVRRYGIGFEIPLWILKFRLGRFFNKFCERKKINKFLSSLPVVKKFGVYTIFLLRKRR